MSQCLPETVWHRVVADGIMDLLVRLPGPREDGSRCGRVCLRLSQQCQRVCRETPGQKPFVEPSSGASLHHDEHSGGDLMGFSRLDGQTVEAIRYTIMPAVLNQNLVSRQSGVERQLLSS